MHEHFVSGAINKETTEYVFPSIASKENNYCCPHCNNDVILRKGTVRVHHFAHKNEASSCSYYTKPTQYHLIHDLKMAMSTLYNIKELPIWFINRCTTSQCRNESIAVLSKNSITHPILRFDKSSNYIVFENTMLQSREDITKEVELKYENSMESIEKLSILKQLHDLTSIPMRFSSISNPFEMRSIFDLEENSEEIPTIKRDLRISDEDIEQINNMLKDSMSNWKVYISKAKAAGTKYFYNSRNKQTTWCIPNDVIREEEILITTQLINKKKTLETELDILEKIKQDKMKNEIESIIKEQEIKHVFLVELVHDNEYRSNSSIDSIKIRNLQIQSFHKHLTVKASKLMEHYKSYMEQSVSSDSNKERDESSSNSMFPFKIKCGVYNNYVCNSCKNKINETKKKEETIRKLFYEKYPMYSSYNTEISYKTTNSPPTVKAEESKQRKRILMRRMRETHQFSAFREKYLMEERLILLDASEEKH